MKVPPQEASMWSTLRAPGLFLECTEKDVLCGRAKQSFSNPGNRRYRAVIEQYREQYQQSSRRAEKSRLTLAVIKVIRDQNSRFLKPTADRSSSPGWVELTDNELYEKVSHALRCTKDPKETVLRHAKSTQPAADSRRRLFARQQASTHEAISNASLTKLIEDDFRLVAARQQAIFRDLIAQRRQLLTDDSDETCLHCQEALPSGEDDGDGTFYDILEGDDSDGSDVDMHDDMDHEPYSLDEVFP
jgi:hypothetical protein